MARWLLYRYLSSFRLCSAPKIFNTTADALEWIIASEGENWLNLLFIILTTFCLVAAQTRKWKLSMHALSYSNHINQDIIAPQYQYYNHSYKYDTLNTVESCNYAPRLAQVSA